MSRRVNKERQCSEKCYLNPEKCLWQKKQKRRVCHSGYVWNATQLDGNSVTGSTFQVPRFLMTDLLGVSLRPLISAPMRAFQCVNGRGHASAESSSVMQPPSLTSTQVVHHSHSTQPTAHDPTFHLQSASFSPPFCCCTSMRTHSHTPPSGCTAYGAASAL